MAGQQNVFLIFMWQVVMILHLWLNFFQGVWMAIVQMTRKSRKEVERLEGLIASLNAQLKESETLSARYKAELSGSSQMRASERLKYGIELVKSQGKINTSVADGLQLASKYEEIKVKYEVLKKDFNDLVDRHNNLLVIMRSEERESICQLLVSEEENSNLKDENKYLMKDVSHLSQKITELTEELNLLKSAKTPRGQSMGVYQSHMAKSISTSDTSRVFKQTTKATTQLNQSGKVLESHLLEQQGSGRERLLS